MKHVLVLGATGMLGAYSALALKSAGYRVGAVSRRLSDNGFFAAHDIPYTGGWDLADPGTFDRLPTEIDAVVHMAGFMPAHGDASVLPYVKSIVEGTANVCEWMRTRTPCHRIVFNTTPADVAIHRGGDAPIPDDAPRSWPRDGGDHAPYAVCKIAATDLLGVYQNACGFRPIVFRHMTVFGWHPDASFNVDGRPTVSPWRQVLRRCLAGRPVEIWGNPKRRSELLYIDDFTAAVRAAIESDATGIFNLPGPRPYTLEEEFSALREVFGRRSDEGSDGASGFVYRPEMPVAPECLLEGSKARKELGWQAVVEWPEACRRIRREMAINRFAPLWGEAEEEDRLPPELPVD